VIDEATASPLLAAGIASMFLTPLLVRAAPHITAGERLLAPLERLIGVRSIDEADDGKTMKDHTVIVGFGLAGRLTAQTLQACGAPYVVLELNADNVRKGKELGLPVFYGDATSTEALQHAHLDHAKLLVLLMNDPQGAQRVVDTVKRVAPNVPMLMRAHYLSEREPLMALGARDVVAEEVEGAVEIIARVLRTLETPRNVIDDRLRDVRANTQTSERKQTVPRASLGEMRALAEMRIESVLVKEGSRALGQSPLTLKLRSQTGALVVGVRRGAKLLENPDPHVPFERDDIVYLVGVGEAFARALPLFEATVSDAAPNT
jgi:CPA2 family monovalent cation:H+ antiporter-2